MTGIAAAVESGILIATESTSTFSVADIEAEPGVDTPIIINLPSRTEEGTFLLIRNIPEGVRFSGGMATGRIRVIPLREASTLRLRSKPGVNALFKLEFHLIGPDNRGLAKALVTVNLRSREAVSALGPASPKPDVLKPPVQPEPQAAPLTPRAEAVLLARGKEVLENGGIAAARIIFEELAKRRSAAGALALAQTYDPAHIPSHAAPEPNLALARKWYERAAELGNSDAKRRLAELAPGRSAPR